jgi:hypothetical protein
MTLSLIIEQGLRILNPKFRSFRGLKWNHEGPCTLKMEAWILNMEPWIICVPVVADSHLCKKEKQDPDPN